MPFLRRVAICETQTASSGIAVTKLYSEHTLQARKNISVGWLVGFGLVWFGLFVCLVGWFHSISNHGLLFFFYRSQFNNHALE